MGESKILVRKSEEDARVHARRGIYANKDIKPNEKITEET